MNKVILIGNVGNDPIIKENFAGFSIATTKKNYKRENVTIWHDCVLFGEKIKLAEYIKKGNKLAIIGEISQNSYEKNGIQVKSFSIIVNELEFLTNKQSGNGYDV